MREMRDTISAPFFATDQMGWLTRPQRSMYLVKFLDFFENEDAIYTAMEYLESGNLADYLDEHSRMREAETITSQISRELVELHERVICHRQLKPQVCTIRLLFIYYIDSFVGYFDCIFFVGGGQDLGYWIRGKRLGDKVKNHNC